MADSVDWYIQDINKQDEENGKSLAELIGSTFIDARYSTPAEEWATICMILRLHGYKVVKVK